VAALEELLKHFSREDNEVFLTGANLHIVNGLGSTDCGPEEEPIPDCPNGLGNLIVGYNEPRPEEENIHTGSHNVVVGELHNFSRFGGVVVGQSNTISGDFASVSGGVGNTASGDFAAVSGGQSNTASGTSAAVSGGFNNTASGGNSSVSGGSFNTASGIDAAVSGGGATPPAAAARRSAGEIATRPAVAPLPSAAASTGRRKASSTGSPAASSKTSRGLAIAGGLVGCPQA
jgi:hypothetical protein